jgi:hypothetical protein
MSAWARYTEAERQQWRAEYERMVSLGYPWQTADREAHIVILRQQMAEHTADLINSAK